MLFRSEFYKERRSGFYFYFNEYKSTQTMNDPLVTFDRRSRIEILPW